MVPNQFTSTTSGQASFGIELPRIASTSSDTVKVGSDVWVKGKFFGNKPGTVKVGGQPVTVTWTGWKDNQLSFDMPSFPNTAKVSIRVITADGAKTNEVFVTIVE
ncbi:MAG: IPT/TIG domain-containing protein [Deltaproteobacteria bacterium]|nr:IPT/TIG domain-containing protein [Deltaproteobacteria bacterium]